MACTCHPSDGEKHKIGGPQSMLAWAKSETLSPKIMRAKMVGGIAQVIQLRCNKHEPS
jgi:hypothetical protein